MAYIVWTYLGLPWRLLMVTLATGALKSWLTWSGITWGYLGGYQCHLQQQKPWHYGLQGLRLPLATAEATQATYGNRSFEILVCISKFYSAVFIDFIAPRIPPGQVMKGT